MFKRLKSWTSWHSLVVFAVPIGLILLLWNGAGLTVTRQWFVAILALLLLIWIVGFGITGRVAGLLIDKRNKMSLSRFQATTWSILVLSTLVTAVFFNLQVLGFAIAANIAIPGEVLGLIGISAAALVGSPILLSARDQKTVVSKPERMKTRAARGMVTTANADNEELTPIHRNENKEAASIADMFKGDEIDNFEYLDLAKRQNFLFNLIIISLYGGTIYAMFSALEAIDPAIAKQLIESARAAVQSGHQSLTEASRAATIPAGELAKLNQSADPTVIEAAKTAVAQANDLVVRASSALEENKAALHDLEVNSAFIAFPEITGGMLALLGISTGGYLANKGVAHMATDT